MKALFLSIVCCALAYTLWVSAPTASRSRIKSVAARHGVYIAVIAAMLTLLAIAAVKTQPLQFL